MRSRILLGTLFGAAGGFLGFVLQEIFTHHDPDFMPTSTLLKLGAYVGVMLGIGIGAVEGAAVGSSRLLLRGMLIGAVMGLIGGVFGVYFGGVLFQVFLFGKSVKTLASSSNLLDFVQLIIARAIGWTFLGAFPGLAAGAATLSRKRMMHGLAGGLIGGFIGGLLFDPLSKVIAPLLAPAAAATTRGDYESGGPSRAIGITVIGLLTGLFIGLVEELMKQAWVRVLAGKNEGKDYIVSKPMTVLGRDERADVPLFGDPSLAPQHAAIKMENNRHYLLDGGAPQGAVVNGQRITQQLLKDGDMIQLGQVRLLFREKATASKIGKPVADAPKTAAQMPGAVSMPSHLCPFCGAAKDAQGGCLCTVPGAGTGGAPAPSYGAPGGMPMGTGQLDPTPGFSPNYGDPMGFGAPPPMDAGYGQPAYGGGLADGGGTGSRLIALDGPYAGQMFPMVPGGTAIGRAPENGVSLVNDSTVSRRHAHIAEENGQHVIYDDGSSNGTFVNRVRINVQALAVGDVVQFGSSSFRYE